jgi:hypothetical protein
MREYQCAASSRSVSIDVEYTSTKYNLIVAVCHDGAAVAVLLVFVDSVTSTRMYTHT